MDFNELVDEILIRVSEHLKKVNFNDSDEKQKTKLLVIGDKYDSTKMLTESKILRNYQIEYAHEVQYKCDLNQYVAIIVSDLSIEFLSKLAHGIADTPSLCLALKALLIGKKIIIPRDVIELYTYKESAPPIFYQMMCEKIDLLINSGVSFFSSQELEKNFLNESNYLDGSQDKFKETTMQQVGLNKDEMKQQVAKKTDTFTCIDKKIITEGDIRNLFAQGVKKISINQKAILTDLAKDYIHNKRIELVRGSNTNGEQRISL